MICVKRDPDASSDLLGSFGTGRLLHEPQRDAQTEPEIGQREGGERQHDRRGKLAALQEPGDRGGKQVERH